MRKKKTWFLNKKKFDNIKKYALEFAVVFFGVWLSLLAEQWRHGRADAAKQRFALENIASDMETEILYLQAVLARAESGFVAAQWLTSDHAGLTGAHDSLRSALTDLGICTFTGTTNASRYEALKTGELGLIREYKLRNAIAQLYESSAMRDFLHDRDCQESDELLDLMTQWVSFEIPPLLRANPIPGWMRNDTPHVKDIHDARSLLQNPVILDRITKLAAQRQFLIFWVNREISDRELLREEILRFLDL